MDARVIETIASINPHFRKLQHPILRKLLASRVTIADAARIGKCELNEFFDRLKPLGFMIEYLEVDKTEIATVAAEQPHKLKVDVRDDLQHGNDPFNRIMKTLKSLNAGDTLLLVNSFEPVPLIKILNEQGYVADVVAITPDEIHTYITKVNVVHTIDKVDDHLPGLFDQIEARFKGKLALIDVRSLPMPQPMMTILKQLEALSKGTALYVVHKRLPKFLLPELKDRQFSMVHKRAENDVHLIIYKDGGST
jgi:uncharacterized protein (DUF2249 family)